MGFEPRMRGPRFRRPSAKKSSSREKREKRGSSISYEEPEEVDVEQISFKTLNALEHLGNQRFALPPFSEHFQRWIKDVKNVLTEFETNLPEAADQQYRTDVEQSLSKAQVTMTRLVEVEKSSSIESTELRKQLTEYESRLSKLDQDYKKEVRDIRRRHEKSAEKLRAEIDVLDKQRLSLLRKRPSFIHRIFGRSDSGLEERTTDALHKKRDALDTGKDELKGKLDKCRIDYETEREHLGAELKALRTKHGGLKENPSDDSVEARKLASQELHQAVAAAVARLAKEEQKSGKIIE